MFHRSRLQTIFLTGGIFLWMALTVAARLLLSITATRRTDELMTRIVVVTTLSVCLFYILKEKRIDLPSDTAGWLVLIMVTCFLTVINHTFGSPLSSDVPNIYKRNYFLKSRLRAKKHNFYARTLACTEHHSYTTVPSLFTLINMNYIQTHMRACTHTLSFSTEAGRRI